MKKNVTKKIVNLLFCFLLISTLSCEKQESIEQKNGPADPPLTSKAQFGDLKSTRASGMTPSDGSVLTESSMLFSWTHSASYHRLYLGTSKGDNDLYDSDNLTSQSHTVRNIPKSGTVYLRLWLYINGSWARSYDYTYTAKSGDGSNGGNTGDKDFIITAVNDDLDPSDMYDFEDGMKSLGYTRVLKNTDVSASELKSYFKRTVKTLYHTGHGFSSGIATSDGSLRTSSVSSVAVENLIIATCLTLKDKSWKNKFVSTTKNIMGYTNYSYDHTDNRVVKNMTNKLRSGKSYLQAWYEVNSSENSLYDRWCCYTRSGNSVVEYSAVSGNNPRSAQTSGSFYPLANGKILVSSSISKSTNRTSFSSTYSAIKDQVASNVTKDVNTLQKCNISQQSAIEKAQNWVSSKGSFKQVEFDNVISLYADNMVIGYQVRFKRVISSLPVRGNSLTDYVSLLITDNDIVTTQYHWSSITPIQQRDVVNVLSPAKALELASDEIASMYKGNEVRIIQAEKCLGYKISESGFNSLVPAYEFISTDGSSIIIDAVAGNVL